MELIPEDQFIRSRKLFKPQPDESPWAAIPRFTSLWEGRQKAAAEGKPLVIWAIAGGDGCGLCSNGGRAGLQTRYYHRSPGHPTEDSSTSRYQSLLDGIDQPNDENHVPRRRRGDCTSHRDPILRPGLRV